MFNEESVFDPDNPVLVRIANITEYPLHFHSDLEIVYVLQGEVSLKRGYDIYRIRENDIYAVNGREVHGLYGENGNYNIVLLMQLDNNYFTKYFKDLHSSFFVTFMKDADDARLDALRSMLGRIALQMIKSNMHSTQTVIDMVLDMLKFMEENFRYFFLEDGKMVSGSQENVVLADRLRNIIDYIYAHHADKISLSDLAAAEHLSPYYVSHLIKKGTGLSFRNFVCYARLEVSEMALLGSNKKISTLADEVGFSAVRYYEKYFYKWFGIYPEEYRKKYSSKIMSNFTRCRMELLEPDKTRQVLEDSLAGRISVYTNPQKSCEVSIDMSSERGSKEFQLNLIPYSSVAVIEKYMEKIVCTAGELGVSKICIKKNAIEKEKLDIITKKLAEKGIECVQVSDSLLTEIQKINMDSILGAVDMIEMAIQQNGKLYACCSMIDDGDAATLLQGGDGFLTAGLIPKPAYYSYLMLKSMTGQVIMEGDNYIITAMPDSYGSSDTICILFYNRACSNAREDFAVREIVESYGMTLNMSVRLKGISGKYRMIRLMLAHGGSLFEYVGRIGQSSLMKAKNVEFLHWMSVPQVEASCLDIAGCITVNMAISGYGVELVILDRI